MGREKERRVKGNLQPAASSRAAELLTTGFGGATPVSGTFGAPAFGAAAEWELADIDAHVKVLFKKLAKRDNVTRVKALEELQAYVNTADVEAVTKILPAWPKTYNRLSADADRRVREMTGAVHLALVQKVRKQLAPHLKEVIGSWLCAQYDPNREVAKLAVDSFQEAFPNKRTDVLLFCHSEILQFITENILHQSPETMSDPRFTTKEDMLSKYSRVVASSYYILTSMIEQLSPEDISNASLQYNQLFDEPKLWSMSQYETPQVRRAVYSFIKTACQKMPRAIDQRLETVSPFFPGKIFSDKDPSTHGNLWDALLIFTKAFPQSWLLGSSKRPVLLKLYSFLKKGTYGSINISYPSFLVLIAHLPREIVEDAAFQKDFLSSFWSGLESGAIDKSSSSIFLESYWECSFFLLLQASRGSEANNGNANRVLELDMFRPIEFYLFPNKACLKAEDLITVSSRYIVKLGTGSQISEQLLRRFMEKLSSLIEADLFGTKAFGSEGDFEVFCIRAADFLAAIHEEARKPEGVTSTVKNVVEEMTARLVRLALSAMGDNGSLRGLAAFVRGLSASFGALLTCDTSLKSTVADFITSKLAYLIKGDYEAIAHILSTAVIYLIGLESNEEQLFRDTWNSIIEFIFGIDREIPEEITLGLVLKQLHDANINKTPSLRNERIDVSVMHAVLALDDADADRRANLEQLISVCLLFGFDEPIVHPETMQRIFNHMVTTVASFTNDYLIIEDPATYNVDLAKANVVASILRILNSIPQHLFLRTVPFETVKSLLPNLLDLSAAAPSEILPMEHQSEGINAEEVLQIVIEQARRLWEIMRESLQNHQGKLDVVVDTALKRWQERFMDLRYCGSPAGLVEQIEQISAIVEGDNAARNRILSFAVQNEVTWQTLARAHGVQDISLMIVEPLALMDERQLTEPLDAAGEHRDIHGLSTYARVAMVMEQLAEKVTTKTLLTGGREWLMAELLRFSIICKDRSRLHKPLPWDDERGTEAITIEERILALMDSALDDIQGGEQWHVGLIGQFRTMLKDQDEKFSSDDLASRLLLEALRKAINHGGEYVRVLKVMLQLSLDRVGVTEADARGWVGLISQAMDGPTGSLLLALLPNTTLSALAIEDRQSFVTRVIRNILRKDGDQSVVPDGRDISVYLSLLSTVLGLSSTPDDAMLEHELLPTLVSHEVAVDLVRRVRKWYEQNDSSNIRHCPQHVGVHKEVAALLEGIVKHVDVGIDLGGFVIRLSQAWIQEPVTQDFSRVLLYYALRLYNGVLESQQMHATTQSAARAAGTYERLLDLFLQEAGGGDGVLSEPVLELQRLLAQSVLAVPEEVLLAIRPFDKLCDLLYTHNEDVQKVAFGMLRRITAESVQAVSLRVEMSQQKSRADEQDNEKVENGGEKIPGALVATVSRRIADFEHTDQVILAVKYHDMLGYILGWMLIYDHFEGATFDLRTSYISHLRELGIINDFLEHLFVILEVGWSRSPFDLSRWEIDHFDVPNFDISSQIGFQLLAAHLYWRALRHTPSLVRIWWSECKNRQLTLGVESYTEKWFSPTLIRTEVDLVQNADKSDIQDLTIKASKSGNEVSAAYKIEDATLEMVIRLPNTFPLRQVDVDSGVAGAAPGGRAAGISESRWRAWLLSASAVIASQNGSILDAVKLFGRNISLHFEGVEDCAICYSVIGVIDRTLPTKQCKTCKHKFHASCLFKWFRTSNQSTCPLCRQPTF